jgi:hypothetical protein
MTPCCDTCQLDFRPGEEADMETWERDGVARCIPCASEYAALRRLVDENGPGIAALAACLDAGDVVPVTALGQNIARVIRELSDA